MQKIQELITQQLAAQKTQLFIWVPFFFAIGIAIYFSLQHEPPLRPYMGMFLLLAAASYGMSRRQYISDLYKISFLGIIAISLVLFGFLCAQIRTQIVYTPMLTKKMMPVGVVGTIESVEPLGGKDGSRIVLKQLEVERLPPEKTPRKIRIKVRKAEGLRTGQRVKVLAGLNPPSGPVAPGAFDFQRMAFFKGIGAVGFAYNAPKILRETKQSRTLSGIREAIAGKITKHMNGPEAPVLLALMTGQRGAIAEAHKEALRGAGLAHLLAISGLHVGMVAAVLFFFSRLCMAGFPSLALKYPIKKWAAAIALIGALFYTLIVGATIPTQRALIMTGLVMTAIMFDRSPFSLRLVAFAAFIVLLFSPESLTSVSFQMSFAAVIALICFYEAIRPFWMEWHRRAGVSRKIILYFAGVLLTTLIAGAATGLFALYHFQQYAQYGMLANIVAVPLMAFIVMPFIVFSYVLMPMGLENISLQAAGWGVEWILATAQWVNGMEGAVLHIGNWPQWIFVGMVICLWFLLIWQGRFRFVSIPVFILLCALTFVYKQPDILISSKVDLVAIGGNNGSLWLSTGRTERYSADNWMRLRGREGEDKNIWPREGSADGFPLTCDPYGCRGEVYSHKVSIAYTQKAWQEDCVWADIVISQTPVPYKECQAQTVIDFFDVWRQGPHALWLTPNKVKVRTVEEVRGRRPWTQTAANQKED